MADESFAIPSFARKYRTTCSTCHTIYPKLNAFGEAFRRNGYRYPSGVKHEKDSDHVQDEDTLPLGHKAYEKVFPNATWPDRIMQAVPLSLQINGAVSANLPDSEAKDQAGNTFTWNGIVSEFHLFAAGAFNDSLTYFSEVTLSEPNGVSIEHAYLLWNDIVGPEHLFNLWIGRLVNPQLSSFGMHSSYVNDTAMPGISPASLFNPTGTFALGMGAIDGLELNGVVAHRLDYAVGWHASDAANTLHLPNAQNVYGHLGAKFGGLSLDGEGTPPPGDATKPWAETALTVDAFAYHGRSRLDNGTSADSPPTAVPQDDVVNAMGGSLRFTAGSFELDAGGQVERHSEPYQGTAGTPASGNMDAVPGTPNTQPANAAVAYGEASYIVFPWLVPAVRGEYTRVDVPTGGVAQFARITPGLVFLVRANIKASLRADLEYANGMPAVGSWAGAGGLVVVPDGQGHRFVAEQITASWAWAY